MKKIQQIIIMLAVLIFAAAGNGAMAQLIELGGWNTGDWSSIFIPKAALDTASCLTHIPEGYSVKSFTIGLTKGGYFRSETSNSSQLTLEQRAMIAECNIGDVLYLEDIYLVNDSTK